VSPLGAQLSLLLAGLGPVLAGLVGLALLARAPAAAPGGGRPLVAGRSAA
jgi:hypothetical protein